MSYSLNNAIDSLFATFVRAAWCATKLRIALGMK